MGTISSPRAWYGLQAVGTPGETNIAGTVNIGVGQTAVTLTGCDIAYSFKITSAAAGNVATLDLSNGTVAQTTGSPTISRSGEDFEGATLTTMVHLFGLLIRRVGTIVDSVTVAAQDTAIQDGVYANPGAAALQLFPSGLAFTTNTDITFTFSDAADEIEVTVIGKSS